MYKSTRGGKEVKATEAIISGIAKDGGLYIKDITKVFSLDELQELSTYTYQKLAEVIFSIYFDDLDNLSDIIKKAYQNNFDVLKKGDDFRVVNTKKCLSSISPTVYFLELYHGKTMAFKDVALSVLPFLLNKSKQIQNDLRKTVILTATSGDTGSAALCGFHSDKNTKMIVLYPTDGVSNIQEKQMLSFAGENQKVIGITGNFDDAQNIVKKAFNDQELISSLNNSNLSSANSINIGRLVPQIVYYFYSYFDLVREKEIEIGSSVNFVVPTGNFGNILACFMAKKMGLPVNKIICASNSNKVLTDFFNTHTYDKNRSFYKTSSPSMDILISSNLERLLYYIYEDTSMVKELMNNLTKFGKYEVEDKYFEKLDCFYGVYCKEEETLLGIKKVYDDFNYLIDPHTAVGYMGYLKYLKYFKNHKDDTPTIIASTASPFKFPQTIAKALNIESNGLDDFSLVKKISEYTNSSYPKVIDAINLEYFKTIWEKENAYENLCKLLKELTNE